MTELELRRTATDRRLYALDCIGTLRFEGFWARTATAEADGHSWSFSGPRGLWRRVIQATDATGIAAGWFEASGWRWRGGTMRWDDRHLGWVTGGRWRERYVLVESERELALLDGNEWSWRPVRVTVVEPQAIAPGPLPFAAFVVHQLANDRAAAAAASS